MEMKRVLSAFILVLALVCLAPTDARAHTVEVGLTSYYGWWQPAWRDHLDGTKVEPALMPGAFLKVGLLDNLHILVGWRSNFSLVDYKASFKSSGTVPSPYAIDAREKINMTDFDLNLIYSFAKNLDIIGGCRITTYQMGQDQNKITITPAPPTAPSVFWDNGSEAGVQLGAAYSYPLASNLSVRAALVALYLSTSFNNVIMSYDPGTNDGAGKSRYWTFGGLATLDLAYAFPSTGMALALGGSFQYLHYSPRGKDHYDLSSDLRYGMTLGVSYGFD